MKADYFKFNGIKSTDKNITLEKYERPWMAEDDSIFTEIEGRRGSLLDEGVERDILITLYLSWLIETENDDHNIQWAKGRGKLEFPDLPNKHFMGKIISTTPMEDHGWHDFEAIVRADPIIYGEDKNLALPTINNAGSIPSPGKYILTAKAGSYVEIQLGNQKIRLEKTFKNGDQIIIEDDHVTIDGVNGMKYLVLESRFFEVPAGNTTFTLKNCTGRVEFTERWGL